AWAYRAQLKDHTLLDLEAVAREFKRGLWALHKTEQQPPWEWRKEMRSARRYTTRTSQTGVTRRLAPAARSATVTGGR
ncbi:hypothetical protein ACC724_39945, partial [Rhizobium ruizarguesonis]